MRATTKLVLATLALGMSVGLAGTPAMAAAPEPQPVQAMDDCIHADPFADPPYASVNPDDCTMAFS